MFESLRSLFPETEVVVEPDFKKGMQHFASPVVSINGESPLDHQYAKWVREIMGKWDNDSPLSARKDLVILDQFMDGVARVAKTQILDDASITVDRTDKPAFYPSYVMIQEAVEGSEVSEDDLHNVTVIRESIRDVVITSWEMYQKEGMAVDLVGFDSMKDISRLPFDKNAHLRLHNFRKDNEGAPVLIDTRLLEPRRVIMPARSITDFLVQFQHFGLQSLLNEHLAREDQFKLDGGNLIARELAERCFDFTRRFRAASAI
ncbi:MAG: hypothetical protein NTZ25_00085 [Candidatus Peregrinibacteria bacterium]|nr:hypothetical protein [Candidatus Peregrinibacteria bacterium]